MADGRLHPLKTWPEPFTATWNGLKPFEIREDDRGFAAGDRLQLLEWDPTGQRFTGRQLMALVTYVLRGQQAVDFGLRPGFVAMGVFPVEVFPMEVDG
jgi:hypothetical protein